MGTTFVFPSESASCIQHVLDEDTIPHRWIAHQDMDEIIMPTQFDGLFYTICVKSTCVTMLIPLQ